MPSDVDNLRLALANISAKMAEVMADPRPDYSVGGRSFSWSSYYSMLTDQYMKIREALIAAEGPWTEQIQVMS